jgi:hypothetical protein
VHRRVTLKADRDSVWIVHRGQEVARYGRSHEPGGWRPAPRLRPEPPPRPQPAELIVSQVAPAELSDYPVLCA